MEAVLDGAMPIKSTQCVDIMVRDDLRAPKDCSSLLCWEAAVLGHFPRIEAQAFASGADGFRAGVDRAGSVANYPVPPSEPMLQEDGLSRLSRIPWPLQPFRSGRIISHGVLRGIQSNELSRSRYIHCSSALGLALTATAPPAADLALAPAHHHAAYVRTGVVLWDDVYPPAIDGPQLRSVEEVAVMKAEARPVSQRW